MNTVLFSHVKEENPATLDEHIDAKGNKPGGERKILNLDFIICGILKNKPETESRKLWPGPREK